MSVAITILAIWCGVCALACGLGLIKHFKDNKYKRIDIIV